MWRQVGDVGCWLAWNCLVPSTLRRFYQHQFRLGEPVLLMDSIQERTFCKWWRVLPVVLILRHSFCATLFRLNTKLESHNYPPMVIPYTPTSSLPRSQTCAIDCSSDRSVWWRSPNPINGEFNECQDAPRIVYLSDALIVHRKLWVYPPHTSVVIRSTKVYSEPVGDVSLGRYNKVPRMRVQKAENVNKALDFIASRGVKLTNIGPEGV